MVKNVKANQKSKNTFFERYIKENSWKINKKETQKRKKINRDDEICVENKNRSEKTGCRKLKDIQKWGKEK